MNKTMKLILGIFLFLIQYSFGQTYNYPKCNSQAQTDIKIVKVTRGDYSTTVDFELVRIDPREIYVFLNSPNTEGAYYIKADGKTYKLTSISGIADKNGVTIARQYKPFNFSATFEAIPKTITKFDLIEGGSTGSWHFYGVQLNSIQSSNYDWDKMNGYLGKSKADVISILSNNDKLIFRGINQSKDGIQFLHYIYKDKDDFSEAFFFDNESVCIVIKHIYPMRLYIETVQTFNSNRNLELKSNDLWVDVNKRLTYGIRMVPGTKSFAIEVSNF